MSTEPDAKVKIVVDAETRKAVGEIKSVGDATKNTAANVRPSCASIRASMMSASEGVRDLTKAMRLLTSVFGPIMAIASLISIFQKLWEWGNKAFEWIQKIAGVETAAERIDRLGKAADAAADRYRKLTDEIGRNTRAMQDNARHAQAMADEAKAQELARLDAETARGLAATADPEERRRIQEGAASERLSIEDRHGRDALRRETMAHNEEVAQYRERLHASDARRQELVDERDRIERDMARASGDRWEKLNEQRETNRGRIDEFNSERASLGALAVSLNQRAELLTQRTATQSLRNTANIERQAQAKADADRAEDARKAAEDRRKADQDAKRAEADERRRASVIEAAEKRIQGITVSAPAAATSISAIGGTMGEAAPRIQDRQLERFDQIRAINDEMRRSLSKIEQSMEGD